jgi:hypothetical protein
MAEMTLPFWLTSAVLEETQTVNDWLKAQRVQPRWIDEVIHICDPRTAPALTLSGLEKSTPQFNWPEQVQSDFFYLQAACREIAVGERRLILLLSGSGLQRTAVLLASPSAAGMYNLMPLAYVEELSCFHVDDSEPDLLQTLENALTAKEKKAAQVKDLLLLQTDGKRPVKSESAFSGASWVKVSHPAAGSLAACHDLVQQLATKKHSNGLAAELSTDRHLYLTWIECI